MWYNLTATGTDDTGICVFTSDYTDGDDACVAAANSEVVTANIGTDHWYMDKDDICIICTDFDQHCQRCTSNGATLGTGNSDVTCTRCDDGWFVDSTTTPDNHGCTGKNYFLRVFTF